MRVAVDLGSAVVEFSGPQSAGAYPWLLTVGALRIAARAGTPTGLTAGETPSVQVSLANDGKQASRILDVPLRRPVTIYEDNGDEYFAGIVAAVAIGRAYVLTVEA